MLVLRSGSVIVTGELYTNSVVNKDEVVTKVKEEIRANHDKIHDYEVDPESFRLFGTRLSLLSWLILNGITALF